MLFTLIAGSAGFLFCAAFQRQINEKLPSFCLRARQFLKEKFTTPNSTPHNILLLTHLVASLRAGISLDGAIESAAAARSTPPSLRVRLQKILNAQPPKDFLSSFLSEAMHSGVPALATLLSFQKILQVERRVAMKAASLTSQSRAQGEVLSWLPWIMLAALALMDPEWFFQAGDRASSWLLWSFALFLVGVGRIWMRALLERALKPTSWHDSLQERVLPELILRMISQLSLGRDAESALEHCLSQLKDPALTRALATRPPPECLQNFQNLLHHAAKTGAPLREDLGSMLSDLHLSIESRWEERVQRLPVVMMAPLFLCFFPSCLLVLGGLLLPLLAAGL